MGTDHPPFPSQGGVRGGSADPRFLPDKGDLCRPQTLPPAPPSEGSKSEAPAIGHPTAAIDVTGLSYRYPKAARPALDRVTLSAPSGEIFGVLGPNGGGKTTLFRLLTTLLAMPHGSDAGRASVFGHDVGADPHRVRQQLGVVFQHPSLDGKLTAEENLRCQGRLYGLSGADLRRRIDRWLTRFDLADRRRDYVDTFSGGMRRRLEIAKALLHQPRLLVLDEPAAGLDPGARRDVSRHLIQLRDQLGLTVVLTTHLMDQAERCDRLAILSRGRLAGLDTPDNLKAAIGGDVVTVAPDPAADDNSPRQLAAMIDQRFGPWGDGDRPRAADGAVRLEVCDRAGLGDQIRRAWPGRVRSVTIGRPTLEDAFLKLTGHTFWEPGGTN